MSSPAKTYNRGAVRTINNNKAPGKKQAWRNTSPTRKRKPRYVARKTGAKSVGDNRIPSARTDGQATRLSNYTSRNTRQVKSEAPQSIEGEYRLILSTASRATNDLRSFRTAYKGNGIDYSKCISVAREMLPQLEKEESSIVTCSDFFLVLSSKLIDPQMKNTAEFEHLEFLADKLRRFSDIIPRIKHKLSDCVTNHLAKYCVSFLEETDGVFIKPVNDYEDKIVEFKKSLEHNLKESNDLYDDLSQSCSPFISGFLENGDAIHSKMESIISVTIEACETMRIWVKEDKAYPGILWDTIINSNVDRDKTVSSQKKQSRKQNDQQQLIHKKDLILDKIFQRIAELKIEKKKLKGRMENLADRQMQTDKELADKQEEMDKVSEDIANRKSNSPKYFERLWDKKQLLSQQIAKVEERLEMLDRQDGRYAKMDRDLDQEFQDLQDELDTQQVHMDNLRYKLREYESEIARCAHELKMKQAAIATAKKIREMKLSPQILRKIFFQKMDSTTKDLLQEACKTTAVDIGHAWEALYKDLRFLPKRSKDKLQKDIDTIKLHSVQREKTTRMLAFLSLQKWRIFNKHATIEELIKSLRRIEKFALAHRLEHRFMKSATAKT